jgi:hypothetical protein
MLRAYTYVYEKRNSGNQPLQLILHSSDYTIFTIGVLIPLQLKFRIVSFKASQYTLHHSHDSKTKI